MAGKRYQGIRYRRIMTNKSAILRQLIRDGLVECAPTCNPRMAEHSRYCRWQAAIEQIYVIERTDEEIICQIA